MVELAGARKIPLAFRGFRLRQASVNRRGSLYLQASGLELYGSLMVKGDPCTAVQCGSHGECVRRWQDMEAATNQVGS